METDSVYSNSSWLASDMSTNADLAITKSPLLQLPIEVRLNIWEHLLGQRLIHISCPASNRRKYCYAICQEPLSENESERKFFNPARKGTQDSDHELHRHEDCYKVLSREENLKKGSSKAHRSHSCALSDVDPDNSTRDDEYTFRRHLRVPAAPRRSQRLDLSILRTCNDLHNEVTQILYSTNTFSFARGGVLTQFLQRRSGLSRQFLRRLHLDIEVSIHDADPNNESAELSYWFLKDKQYSRARDYELGKTWYTAMNPDVVRKLRDLRVLHIRLSIRKCPRGCSQCDIYIQPETDSYKHWESKDSTHERKVQHTRQRRLCFLTKLAALKRLRNVTVAAYLIPPPLLLNGTQFRRLLGTSRWLKKQILNPRGSTIYFDKMLDKFIEGKVLYDMREHTKTLKERSDRFAQLAYGDYCRQLDLCERRHRQFEIIHGADDFLTTNDKTWTWLEGDYEYESDDSEDWETGGTIDLECDDYLFGLENAPASVFPQDKHADTRNR